MDGARNVGAALAFEEPDEPHARWLPGAGRDRRSGSADRAARLSVRRSRGAELLRSTRDPPRSRSGRQPRRRPSDRHAVRGCHRHARALRDVERQSGNTRAHHAGRPGRRHARPPCRHRLRVLSTADHRRHADHAREAADRRRAAQRGRDVLGRAGVRSCARRQPSHARTPRSRRPARPGPPGTRPGSRASPQRCT